ncbi:MAG: acetoin utilization protein AcuC [Candidatus Dormibacteraceae bacterium]
MSGEVAMVWGPSLLSYRLSEDHPLQPLRVQLTVEEIERRGLDRGVERLLPRRATEEELARAHAPAYVELVKALSDPRMRDPAAMVRGGQHGFGSDDNPIADGMHDAAAEVCGASLVGAEAVHRGEARHVFQPAGGLHHAARDRASGFCVYNDVAVAIAWLRTHGHRVACVDVDVHHGDGTQWLFYDDPGVLTVSLHESGRYLFPGTGFVDETGVGEGRGTAANLPLSPYTWDEPWLAAFDATVAPLLRAFKPTILVTQDGCDQHLLDPLAHLRCSTGIWPRAGRRFHELAHELCGGRWLALGGGGYAIREVVPRAWTLLFAEIVGRPELAADLCDPETYPPEPVAQERIWGQLERDLGALGQALSLPLALGAG